MTSIDIRRAATLVIGLALCACGASHEDARPAPAQPVVAAPAPAEESAGVAANGLRWKVEAYPARLTMTERGTFRLRRLVTNQAAEPRDALQAMATFTVNGASSMTLDMAFGNGARESRWGALPPRASAFDEREIGESIFTAPGTYTIAMTVDGVTSRVDVTVTP